MDVLAGAIEVQRGGDGQWLLAESGTLMWPGDAIRTNGDGQAGLSFADGSEVVLQGSTTLMLDRFFLRTQNDTVLERFGRMVLFAGSVVFDIQPFPDVPSPWEFVTGSEIIGITGTSGVMAVGQKDAMADMPADIRKLMDAGDLQGALAAAQAAGLAIPADIQAAINRGDQAGAKAAAGAAQKAMTTEQELPPGMKAALDAGDLAAAEGIAQAANFEMPTELKQAIDEGKSRNAGVRTASDRPEIPAAVQAALDAGDLKGAQAAADAAGFTPPADLQKALDQGGQAVTQAQQGGQARPEIPASVQVALEAGDLPGAKAAAEIAGFALPAEIQTAIDQNASAQQAAGVAAEPMPPAVKSALDAGDVVAAKQAATAAGYTMPPDVQGAVDRGFEARRGIDASLEVRPELPADVQAALDAGNVQLAQDLAATSDFTFPPEFAKAVGAAGEAKLQAASQSVAADTQGHQLTFALVEGSAVLTEIVAAKAGAMGDPTASGIRVSEIPAGVGLALPTLKPPDSAEGLQAVIATIAADAQSEAAVAEKAETDDGTKQDQLQGVVARDSDGDGAVDQFAVSFNKAQAQTDAPGEGAQSDKPPADSTPGAQKLPPTSWGVLGAAAVAAQQALNAAEGGPPAGAGSDAPAGTDGGPPPGAQGVPSASQLLEQVKLANMVRLVITDEGARKELVASGDMANSLQTALVNISENDKSRSALGLMARAG